MTFSKEWVCNNVKRLDEILLDTTPKDLRNVSLEFQEKNNISERFNTEMKMSSKKGYRAC